MPTLPLRTLHDYRSQAPKRAPCPHCGTPGRRKQVLRRTVRGLAYGAILLVHVTTGEYRTRCGCCRTFRTQVDGIDAKAQYTNQVREAVLDRLLDDHMSLARIQQALRRDFLLDLSAGFLYDCVRWKSQQLDLAAYRQWTLAQFSGTLCVDELHLGERTLLLATDPLGDFAVAFAVVSHNDQDHLGRFLRQLRDHGFHPRVVVTDGSPLYPAVLAAVWPQAEHQLCVFHVLQEVNRCVLRAVKRLRQRLTGPPRRRRRGRGPRRRRSRAALAARGRQQAARQRRQARKEQAAFIFRHRYLLTRRRAQLSRQERIDLQQMLDWLPSLAVLRQFVDQVQRVLAPAQTPAQAHCRFAELHQSTAFAADPDLAQALRQFTPEKFAKMVAFLRSPLGQRVRTNNHVERLNRQVRHYEKVRYGWRTARGLVRFVVVAWDRQWQARRAEWPGKVDDPAGAGGTCPWPDPAAPKQPPGPPGRGQQEAA